MQDILKYTERAGEDTKDLQRAVEVMCVVPKAANDMMNVGRLQGFRVSTVRSGLQGEYSRVRVNIVRSGLQSEYSKVRASG